MTKDQITTVVGGILDVLDMIDHKDWQGEAIQDLRNTLEPTPALPPDHKRCVETKGGRRCIRERSRSSPGDGTLCWGACDFGPDPESKPASKPTWPPPPVFGMEAVTIANATLTSWHADSTANLEQLCVEVVRATEKHHGIKP